MVIASTEKECDTYATEMSFILRSSINKQNKVQTLLICIQEEEVQRVVTVYTLDDETPEAAEVLFVYVHSLTEGVRVARPSTDKGLKVRAKLVVLKHKIDKKDVTMGQNCCKS